MSKRLVVGWLAFAHARSPKKSMARGSALDTADRNQQHEIMKRLTIVAAILISLSLLWSCSRKPAQVGPPAPEVLVTTVTPQDVPRVLERVATLDGFINANINAQVQGYIVSR